MRITTVYVDVFMSTEADISWRSDQMWCWDGTKDKYSFTLPVKVLGPARLGALSQRFLKSWIYAYVTSCQKVWLVIHFATIQPLATFASFLHPCLEANMAVVPRFAGFQSRQHSTRIILSVSIHISYFTLKSMVSHTLCYHATTCNICKFSAPLHRSQYYTGPKIRWIFTEAA